MLIEGRAGWWSFPECDCERIESTPSKLLKWPQCLPAMFFLANLDCDISGRNSCYFRQNSENSYDQFPPNPLVISWGVGTPGGGGVSDGPMWHLVKKERGFGGNCPPQAEIFLTTFHVLMNWHTIWVVLVTFEAVLWISFRSKFHQNFLYLMTFGPNILYLMTFETLKIHLVFNDIWTVILLNFNQLNSLR